MMQGLTSTRAHADAEAGIERMRELVRDVVQGRNVVVGVNGSFARREATSGSDVDLFLFVESDRDLPDGGGLLRSLKESLSAAGFKLPSSEGVFDEPLAFDSLCETIGGQNDTNLHLTRRMLLLLEGEWLNGQMQFDHIRNALVSRYISDQIRDEQIALFLLNDIIRYWRTICVDYEHKIGLGKAQEIRLLKLRFSRMMLYMGGVVAVGATWGMPAEAKRSKLLQLLSLSPTDRIRQVMGDQCSSALSIYEEFLTAIDEPATRAVLATPRLNGDYSTEYLQLRGRAKEFRHNMRHALEVTFPIAEHPLVPAVLL